jgi:hypothetical protein
VRFESPRRSGVEVAPSHPVWAEMQWPLPTDEWGKGKAFLCKAADCGAVVDIQQQIATAWIVQLQKPIFARI